MFQGSGLSGQWITAPRTENTTTIEHAIEKALS